MNSQIFCFQEAALSSQFVHTIPVKVCLPARADVFISQVFICHTDRAGIGSCLGCSSLHGYRAAWQKPMASEPSSPHMETEKYQHCQERENKNKWKWKGMNLRKYRRRKHLWNPQAPSITHALCYWHQSIFFKFTLKERKSVLFCVLCCSAAYFYRRCGNSWFACE